MLFVLVTKLPNLKICKPYQDIKMLARKSVLWRAYKTKKTRSTKEKYKQCSVECSEAISDYYRNKELDIIKSNYINSFYKYVKKIVSHIKVAFHL